MIPPNVHKLIAALRSGEFTQGEGGLRDDDNCFCCLGVACEIYRRETGQGRWEYDRHDYVSFLGQDAMLPEPVRAWYGFAAHGGDMDDGPPLFEINDKGCSFADIADLIESEPPGLFEP